VQNTEVQLGCMKIRIGSLLGHCVGQVRVRADQGCGIFFTVKRKSFSLFWLQVLLIAFTYCDDSRRFCPQRKLLIITVSICL